LATPCGQATREPDRWWYGLSAGPVCTPAGPSMLSWCTGRPTSFALQHPIRLDDPVAILDVYYYAEGQLPAVLAQVGFGMTGQPYELFSFDHHHQTTAPAAPVRPPRRCGATRMALSVRSGHCSSVSLGPQGEAAPRNAAPQHRRSVLGRLVPGRCPVSDALDIDGSACGGAGLDQHHNATAPGFHHLWNDARGGPRPAGPAATLTSHTVSAGCEQGGGRPAHREPWGSHWRGGR